jgi:hypothetical protein
LLSLSQIVSLNPLLNLILYHILYCWRVANFTSLLHESHSLILDNWRNLALTFVMSVIWARLVQSKWLSEMRSMKMEMDMCWWWSSSTWKRRKRKIKTRSIKAKVSNMFLFCTQKNHRGCEWLKIDRRTIKRRNL